MLDYLAARTAMVDGQIRPSDVTLYPILEAMLAVPREMFVPTQSRKIAYAGAHIDLGDARIVMDPRILAKMLQALKIQPNELVLHVGAGFGYATAVMARMAEAVIAVEEDANFAAEAETRLSEQSADNAIMHIGALAAGAPAHGPYDVILIEGGVEVLPESLRAQLKAGGRIAYIQMDGPNGQCRLGLATSNGINWRSVFDATAPVLPTFAADAGFTF